MKLPDLPRDGVPVSKTMTDVINYLRAITITNVVGGQVKTSSGGTTLEFKPGKRGGAISAAPEIQPWEIYQLTGDGEPVEGIYPNYTCKVWPGSISSMMPTDMMAPITVPKELTYWKAKCTSSDGKKINLIVIEADADPPVTQSPRINLAPAEFEILFAVTLDGKAYRTIGPGNPTANIHLALVTDKASPPAPGMPAQDFWYVWY